MRANFPLIWMLGLFFVSGLALARQSDNANSGSWSGVIINSNCTADEAFAEAAKCTEKGVPAQNSPCMTIPSDRYYTLDPQDQAVGHLGDSVTVGGTLESNTIHVASFKMLTAIGLAVGQKAPAFTARDQFGQEQNLAYAEGSQTAPFFSSFVPPTGDPTAKGSWSSCKTRKHDSKSRDSKWRRSAMTARKS